MLREWNDLEGALRQAQEGLALCEEWGQADALLGCSNLSELVFAPLLTECGMLLPHH